MGDNDKHLGTYITMVGTGFFITLSLNLSWQFIVVSFLIITIIYCMYLFLQPQIIENNKKRENIQARENRRKAVLTTAQLFIAPYVDIWKDLRLANTLCMLRLGRDGKTIRGYEKVSVHGGACQHRSFRVISTEIYSYEELWNLFCLNFDERTSYEGLLELADRFKVKVVGASPITSLNLQETNENKTIQKEKTDINNASEVELTELPGISIVLSKRIIKKRESIGGFKSIDDFFLFLKIKPHMEKQLRQLICLSKMRGTTRIERTNERSVDL